VLRETRSLAPHGLDALHVGVDLRTPDLRLGVHRGRNVSSDYSLLARAAPFLDLPHPRTTLTIVLDGHARFDESGRSAWLSAGEIVQSHSSRAGTEAHGGSVSRTIVLEWSERVGAKAASPLCVDRLDPRSRARLDTLAREIEAGASATALVEIVDLLRAFGLAFARLTRADVEQEIAAPEHQALTDAVARSLSRLDTLPAIDDLQGEVPVTQRTLHRQLGAIADRYALLWGHWRSALHQARVLSALRLLSAPGATTERVAKLAGFRSPSALCHTFAVAGLPSPGALAREARRDPLVTWADHAR
jgi:AraC-like DNA-binding protein